MANNKSVEKILDFLEKEQSPKTKTDIVEGCCLPTKSVNDCLKLLERFNKIKIITNGKTSFVLLKQNCEVVK